MMTRNGSFLLWRAAHEKHGPLGSARQHTGDSARECMINAKERQRKTHPVFDVQKVHSVRKMRRQGFAVCFEI